MYIYIYTCIYIYIYTYAPESVCSKHSTCRVILCFLVNRIAAASASRPSWDTFNVLRSGRVLTMTPEQTLWLVKEWRILDEGIHVGILEDSRDEGFFWDIDGTSLGAWPANAQMVAATWQHFLSYVTMNRNLLIQRAHESWCRKTIRSFACTVRKNGRQRPGRDHGMIPWTKKSAYLYWRLCESGRKQ